MNILKITGIVSILLVASSLNSQTSFIKAYGNTGYDYARDIKQDTDAGYVITGSSSSYGPDNGEAYLLKLDNAGDFVWSYNYGGTGSDWGEGLVVTTDDTYAIAGYTNSFGAGGFDFYLVRIDADGTPLWEKTYGGSDWDRAYALVQLPDNGFILAGETFSFNGGVQSGYIVRTDEFGEVVWETFIDDPAPSFFHDIALDGDSIVMVGGIGDGGVDTYDGFVTKFHIDGTFGWEKRIGREYNDYFNAISSVEGIYSLGGMRGYNFPTEKENMWMYRMEDIGVEIIDTTFVNLSVMPDEIHDVIARDFDQDYYFVGETASYGFLLDEKADIIMAKMSLSGVQFAANNYGEAGEDIGRAIDRTADNGVVFVCDSKYFATGGNNILVIKLGPTWTYPNIDDLAYDNITSSVDEEELVNELFTVYPNPTTNMVTLPTNLNGSYTINTLDGKLVSQAVLNGSTIDLSDLAIGTYVLRIQTEEGIYTTKIVKN